MKKKNTVKVKHTHKLIASVDIREMIKKQQQSRFIEPDCVNSWLLSAEEASAARVTFYSHVATLRFFSSAEIILKSQYAVT